MWRRRTGGVRGVHGPVEPAVLESGSGRVLACGALIEPGDAPGVVSEQVPRLRGVASGWEAKRKGKHARSRGCSLRGCGTARLLLRGICHWLVRWCWLWGVGGGEHLVNTFAPSENPTPSSGALGYMCAR